MNKIVLLLVSMLIMMVSCQSGLTPMPPTSTPLPAFTVSAIPPTLTATLSPTLTLTVKFTEKGCTYDGPQSIPYGKFTVRWIVDDPKHNKTVLAILTLASGKTLDDLQACPCTEKPDWINALWLDDENAFGSELEKTRSYVHDYDLKDQASYHGEPLYMFCGNEKDGKTDALGPIAVEN